MRGTGANMTLDALFQLIKIISPSETPSDGDLANFMTLLISTKNHSDALLPFSQRAYMLSVAYRDPQKQLRCFHPVSPKQATLSRCSTSLAGRTCVTPLLVNYRRPSLRTIFTRFRLPPRYYVRQLLTLSNRKTRQHFIFWIRCST